MRAARASRRSDRRAPSTSFAPRSASSSAVASPIPLLAPVMATTLPSLPPMLDEFLQGDRQLAPPLARGVIDRIGDGRGHAHDAELPHRFAAEHRGVMI